MAVAYQSEQTAFQTTSNITVTKPTSTAQGDLLIGATMLAAFVGTGSPTTDWVTIPTGWANVFDTTLDNGAEFGRLADYWLLAGGSEPANYTWGNGTGDGKVIHALRFTGTAQSSPISDSASNTASLTGPNIANVASGDGSVCICMYSVSASGSGFTGCTGTGWTYVSSVSVTKSVPFYIAVAYNTTSTGTVTGPTFTTADTPVIQQAHSFRIKKLVVPSGGFFALM